MLSSLRGSTLYISLVSLGISTLVDSVAVKARTPYAPNLSSLRIRQTNGSYTPVVGCSGEVVDRRGITELQEESPDVFNMFLLALRDLQDDGENEDSSWYQVAGIHGYPYVPWQEDPDFEPPNPNRGYCTHRSALFTTWHRPYLSLLEQLLCEKAKSIAEDFEGYGAVRWRDAAEKVRLPYWDWASEETESRIPPSVGSTSISVTGPNGEETIENPLFNYDFLNPQPPDSRLGEMTVRDGSDEDLVETFPARKLATLNLFTVDDYNQFSDDVESIHDWVHVFVGGDMGRVPTSAFDPIFWLHHVNVDRLMAMYQATHPGSTLSPRPRSPTFALGGSGPDDLNTRLYPFRHPDLSGWTSNDVSTAESIFTYGYSYPEVPQGLSQEELSAFTTEKVNELYGPEQQPAAVSRLALGPESGMPDTTTSRLEWTCNVQVSISGLVGSYRIQVYIGGAGDSAENAAGAAAIFGNPDSAVETPNDRINASVPLTPTLIEKGISLSPNETVPMLADELNWVIQRRTDDGTEYETVDASSLGDDFVVSVVSNEAIYPPDPATLPTKGEPITYYEPTVEKAGGLQPGESVAVGTKVASSTGNGTALASTSARKMLRERSVRLW